MRLAVILISMGLSMGLPHNTWAIECQGRPSWQALQGWMEKSLKQEQMLPIEYGSECIIPQSGQRPQMFGKTLFHYLWFESQYHHISTFLKRGVTQKTLQRYKKLHAMCMQRFDHSCGKYLKHRNALYSENTLESMFLN